MPSHEQQLIAAFNNCKRRNVPVHQLNEFLERCRKQWASNPEMLAVVEQLKTQI